MSKPNLTPEEMVLILNNIQAEIATLNQNLPKPAVELDAGITADDINRQLIAANIATLICDPSQFGKEEVFVTIHSQGADSTENQHHAVYADADTLQAMTYYTTGDLDQLGLEKAIGNFTTMYTGGVVETLVADANAAVKCYSGSFESRPTTKTMCENLKRLSASTKQFFTKGSK